MKLQIIVSALLLVAVIASLGLPWYSVTTSQEVTQTFGYTYSVPTTSFVPQQVYVLPSPITLQGFLSSIAGSSFYRSLANVTLQSGMVVHVEATICEQCYVFIDQNFGNKGTVYDVRGTTTGDFIVVDTGRYEILVDNLGYSAAQAVSLTITADLPQEGMNTLTDANTVSYTTYNVTNMAPIVMIASGLIRPLTSFFVILGLLAVGLVLSSLTALGGFTIKVSRRRRR